MCRNIKVLRNSETLPSNEEIEAAALQFVRKITGYRNPSKVNKEVFDKAVHDISHCAKDLFNNLTIRQ
jgi:hypothetical protein